jgi:acetoacetyl-CoA synthetase
MGVKAGDRVAAFMPNMPETIIAMLAASSIGAVWSSCSPDFGVRGVLDRFGQIEPKVLIACDGYRYAGKVLPSEDKLKDIVAALPTLEKTIIVPFIDAPCDLANATRLPDLIERFAPNEIEFAKLPFSHPLYIMFSSGTTGAPKCIVHSAGGTLIQQAKEHYFNCDVKDGDVVFYFTTCGWMMWNWLVAGLACGATLALYDGSPFHPDGNVLFDFADEVGINVFGTSAKFIDSLNKAGLSPRTSHSLATVKSILSTGSPLVKSGFDYVYEHIKEDVALCSISGGTDIVSCFVLGNPIGPVWRGEIQAKGLGMAVDVWDEDGKPIVSEKGELVCAKAFPSMPTGFWNDANGTKYHSAYFERFDNVWCHGDFAEITEHGGIIIYGRSDATLNPGGVRIGTAEIYAQVEKLPEIVEAIAVGQNWDGDVRIVLFVVLTEGSALNEDLTKKIKAAIRSGASPRHVPAKVLAVLDIPRTKSGKITELAVRDVIHGREIKNKEALANPEALEYFKDRAELGF